MFHIFDCNGKQVGNPNGYARHSDAIRVMNNKRTKAYNQVWNTFYSRKDKQNTLIWEVK